MRTLSMVNRLYFDINNEKTNLLTRLGYFSWIMSGSNLVQPMLAYTDKAFIDENSDDGKGVLSAVGARFRNWVGVDAFVKAKEINEQKNEVVMVGDREEQVYTKPSGIDQMEQMFYDINHGMEISHAGFFDPSVDFKETVKSIDLLLLSFSTRHNSNVLKMDLVFSEFEPTYEQLNEQWSFMVIHRLMSNILDKRCGTVDVSVINPVCDYLVSPVSNSTFMSELFDVSFGKYDCNELSFDFKYFFDLEKHLRMQANEETFSNPQIAVPQLINLLSDRLVSKINNSILKDIANTLIVAVLIKHTVKYVEHDNIYNEQIAEFLKKIKDVSLMSEIKSYAEYIGKKI